MCGLLIYLFKFVCLKEIYKLFSAASGLDNEIVLSKALKFNEIRKLGPQAGFL